MIEFLILVIAYFAFLIIIGIYAHKKTKKTAEDYFLANRTFGPIILFFTLAATNFSAFTFLGFAGKAYDSGFGQYGIMAFGTAIMAIMFYIIGRKVWKLGKEKGYITPPELIGDRFKLGEDNIILTSGSTELIYHVSMSYGKKAQKPIPT